MVDVLTERLRSAVLDLGVVMLFVIIGRREHDDSSALGGIATTAAPFLIGLVVAWVVAVGIMKSVDHLPEIRSGLIIWPVTVLVGMLARRLLFDDGTAVAFVIVTTLFLGVGILGWRAIRSSLSRRRSA